MAQEFNKVRIAINKRSTFDMSHHQVTTTDFGKIIPIACREVLPGDKWSLDPKVFIRLFPLAAPTYGYIKCRVHTFFVPNRIMWKEWNNYISGKSNQLPPYLHVRHMCRWLATEKNFDSANKNPRGLYSDVMSNLGLSPTRIIRKPVSGESGAWINVLPLDFQISAFPYLAYQRIWFDWFRDSNLNQDEDWFNQFTSQSRMSEALTGELMARRDACFKKDYFTTAKLNPQEGDPASASATFQRAATAVSSSSNPVFAFATAGTDEVKLNYSSTVASQNPITSSVSVAIMRLATAYQRYRERNNFVGSRIIDRIFANFGVKPTAERLDMAEYVGGYDFPVQIGDVTSTSQYAASSPWGTSGLGVQAGKGIASSQNDHNMEYTAYEHGILMSVMSILPDTGYYQGVHRMWTRGYNGDGYLEYFNQNFENLGFQPILARELYVPDDANYSNYNPSSVWGHSPRYSDYKFQPDVLAGDFVYSDTAAAADSFHLFRKLYYDNANPMALNENFTQCHNTANDFDRIFQVTDNQLNHFSCDISVQAKATRNMSDFAEPSIADVQESDGRKVELPYGGTRL